MNVTMQPQTVYCHRTYFSYPGAVNHLLDGKLNDITLMELLQTICNYRDVNVEDVLVKCRARQLVETRHLFHHFAKKYFSKRSLQVIGDVTGHNHATVMHGMNTVKTLCFSDRKFKNMVWELNSHILLKHKRND